MSALARGAVSRKPPRPGARLSLNLSMNDLTSVPDDALANAALEELDLAYNRLTALPPTFARLAALRRLGLGDNALADFPPVLLQLTTLEELSLRGNGLTQVQLAGSARRRARAATGYSGKLGRGAGPRGHQCPDPFDGAQPRRQQPV